MLAALRGAIYEALKREEENLKMFERFCAESDDEALKGFFRALAEDTKQDMKMLKNLNLHSIMKFGMRIKFKAPKVEIDSALVDSIKNKEAARQCLKLSIDQLNTNIEYYEHIADHSVFPENKRLLRIIADKELEDKSRVKALLDLLE
jgi:rubrerythrin